MTLQTRIAMAVPHACVSCYYVCYAENPDNRLFDKTIKDRQAMLKTGRDVVPTPRGFRRYTRNWSNFKVLNWLLYFHWLCRHGLLDHVVSKRVEELEWKPIHGDGFVENDVVGTKGHYWNGRNVEGYQTWPLQKVICGPLFVLICIVFFAYILLGYSLGEVIYCIMCVEATNFLFNYSCKCSTTKIKTELLHVFSCSI